ncbi:unnamed protein product [Nippostrongylus brasiliensis]|uniref:TIL domain-containing protein n=1 Tax=Nippostrongylus brasiliensis TaxID=27835 RepID=A0A0N4YF22_NIPBR|nr:hypothetical protein Q1695_002182 [Nippostrongylus brasiliensis]VDL78925.1 unnamed protein product [Nippostrongylus brasiliensis]
MEIAPVDPAILPSCSTILCRQGYKSVMAEPANCFGCITRPQCVQQQCDTTCFCSRFQKCVLVATDCCPVPSCRSMITLKPPTIRTIRFTLEPPMETIVPGPGDPVEQPM